MTRLFLGVEHARGNPFREAIIGVTKTLLKPPWVIGPTHPAIHAFVAWLHADGTGYRLDAQVPRSVLSFWGGPGEPATCPTALWELCSASGEVGEAAFLAAVSKLVGVPYDLSEIAAQPVARVVEKFLGSLPPPPFARDAVSGLTGQLRAAAGLSHAELIHGAVICTSLSCSVLESLGGIYVETVAAIADRIPESVAQQVQQRAGPAFVRYDPPVAE